MVGLRESMTKPVKTANAKFRTLRGWAFLSDISQSMTVSPFSFMKTRHASRTYKIALNGDSRYACG